MPKGEGQLREALEKIVAEYDAYIKGPQIMPTAGLIGALVAGELALQSTPSSPPLAPNKPGSGVLSPETIEKAVEVAEKFFDVGAAPSDAGQPDYRARLIEVAQALGYDASIVDNESCNALAHSVKTLAENYARLFAAPPPLEKLRELEALRDEMWRASDNRFAANYAIQTPGEFAGYVIPADKAQKWADRLQAILAASAPRPAEKD